MKFSDECSAFLTASMFVDVVEFEQYLEKIFGKASQVFDPFVSFMINDPSGKELQGLNPIERMTKDQEFEDRCFSFLKSKGYECGDLWEYAYEIICYFSWYYSGGILELFKHRQAESQGPRIYLTKIISNVTDISTLPRMIEAYRGMSIAEWESGRFGMSWSLDIEKAKEFAFTVYYGEPSGVVVKAYIPRDMVFYFDPDDTEREIAIENNADINGLIVCR